MNKIRLFLFVILSATLLSITPTLARATEGGDAAEEMDDLPLEMGSEPASTADEVSPEVKVMRRAAQINKEVRRVGVTDVTCSSCKEEAKKKTKKVAVKKFIPTNDSTEEDSSGKTIKCGTYLDKDFAKLDPYWTHPYSEQTAEGKSDNAAAEKIFPKECMKQMLKTEMHHAYSHCPDPTGTPVRTKVKPCVTDSYVEVMHKTYTQLMACIGDETLAKTLAPKIMQESGFQVNTIPSTPGHNDAGVGQLTRSAIEEVNDSYFDYDTKELKPKVLHEFNKKGKICENMKFVKIAPTSVNRRCELTSVPENPFKNIAYAALAAKRNLEYVDVGFKGMIKELRKKGLKKWDEDGPEFVKLKHMIAILGYNCGPGPAMSMFRSFIRSRAKLTAADFDFNRPGGIGVYIKQLHKSEGLAGAPGYLSGLANAKRKIDTAVGGAGKCTAADFLSIQ